MTEFRYDTYCGLYCGACEIMSLFKTAMDKGDKPRWEDLAPEMRKGIRAGRTDEIMCYGCKSDTLFIGCSKCLIRKCARNRMHVEACPQCGKFPCMRFRVFSLVMKLMQGRLPHVKSARANRACIRNKGMAQWLSEQEAFWKCPACGKAFSWYAKICPSCGRDLDFQRRFSGRTV